MPVVLSQVRVCVPVPPQVAQFSEAGPTQLMLVQTAPTQEHMPLHVSVPVLLAPHARVSPGMQPSTQADQSLSVPVAMSQVRRCVPHLLTTPLGSVVHERVVLPVQVCPLHAASH